jgi:hypothetical protein
MKKGMFTFVLLTISLVACARGGDDRVGLADLPAYLKALGDQSKEPAQSVRFRDLWDRPEDFQGRKVMVAGTIQRIFRQPAVGEFPALAEVWIRSDSGDPFCLVSPVSEPALAVGRAVEFRGTFLKRVRYSGGDGPRLAPLIVGPRMLAAEYKALADRIEEPSRRRAAFRSPEEWIFAAIVFTLAAVLLVIRHLAGPPRRITTDPNPPIQFIDSPAEERSHLEV